MYKYNIRKQIEKENKKKVFSEFIIFIIVLAIQILVMFYANFPNPFKIVKVNNKSEIEKLYDKGVDFVKFENMTLSFIGYSNLNKDNEIIYNCYSIDLGKKSYLVYISANHSEDKIENFSAIARLKENKRLLNQIASDYDIIPEKFLTDYDLSYIILDTVNTRISMYQIIVIVFELIVAFFICYFLYRYKKAKDILYCEGIKKVSKKYNINKLLDKVEREIKNKKVFDCNTIKITKNWLVYIYNNDIDIIQRKEILSVEKKERLNKIYGFINLGYKNYIKIKLKSGEIYELVTENMTDCEDIFQILKK